MSIAAVRDLRQALMNLSCSDEPQSPLVRAVIDRADTLLRECECPCCHGTGLVVDVGRPLLESPADCLVPCLSCEDMPA